MRFWAKNFSMEICFDHLLPTIDTLLSCKKSEKINDPNFHKVQKSRFLADFQPKFAQNFFFSKIGLRHIQAFIDMHLCAKNQKIWMSQSREKLKTK